MMLAVVSAEEEIRAIAPMASLILALLGIFTNLRLSAYKEYAADVSPFSWKTVVGALPDFVLALFTLFAVVVMAPLCFDAFSFCEIWQREAVLSTMFALIWLGFVALLLFQLGLAVARLVKAKSAGSK